MSEPSKEASVLGTLTGDLYAAVDAHATSLALADSELRLTYAALGKRVRDLARGLCARGVQTGDRVALLSGRSVRASAAFHGIMAARAVAVPLAVGGPPGRAELIIANAGAMMLLHDEAFAGAAQAIASKMPGLSVVLDETLAAQGAEADGSEELARPEPSDLAYIIFTSGSTGVPKGVAYDHGAARLFPEWARARWALGPQDRVAALAPLHFDLATLDLFAALSSGASVLVAPHEALLFPRTLAAWLVDNEITITYAVPSLYTSLVDKSDLGPGSLPNLRALLFAGEVFPMHALNRVAGLAPNATLDNLYGPTETNVCTALRLERAPAQDDPPLSIGEALPFFDAHIDRPDTDGIGELIIEGPGVMRGYWGDPPLSSPRRHATGDYVSRGIDGALHFHGRRDRMIKLRGHRVELAEVEHVIASSQLVSEVAVVVRGEGVELRLVAYYSAPTDPGARALKSALSRLLPHYMMPSELHFLSALPRTSTGKVALDSLSEAP